MWNVFFSWYPFCMFLREANRMLLITGRLVGVTCLEGRFFLAHVQEQENCPFFRLLVLLAGCIGIKGVRFVSRALGLKRWRFAWSAYLRRSTFVPPLGSHAAKIGCSWRYVSVCFLPALHGITNSFLWPGAYLSIVASNLPSSAFHLILADGWASWSVPGLPNILPLVCVA